MNNNTAVSEESWSLIQPVKEGDTLFGFIAIHRGSKTHPAFGATRISHYNTHKDALNDALNLSSLMSHKSALAGIPYGGGKGVLFDGPHMKTKEGRAHALRVYTKHVNALDGKFVTGSDAGVTQDDVDFMGSHSPHIVGIKEDPTTHTAEGLLHALDVVREEIFDNTELSLLSVAIQGVGKVGGALLPLLYGNVSQIFVADTDTEKITEVRKMYPNIHIVSPEEILFQDVDILIPCALGGVLTVNNASQIKARSIVGSANNQLAHNDVGELLHARGILYAPDCVVNAGGLISVVHEFEKNNDKEALHQKVHSIKAQLRDIIQQSKKEGISTHRIAQKTAMHKINELFS